MKIITTIFTNNPERGKEKLDELVNGKPHNGNGEKRDYYFESDTEIIQVNPITQNQRAIKNHYVWIDVDSDYSLDNYRMMASTLMPMAEKLYNSYEEYKKNEYLHLIHY